MYGLALHVLKEYLLVCYNIIQISICCYSSIVIK